MLEAIEHIRNRYQDAVFRSDQYAFFVQQFDRVLDDTFHVVDGTFIRKSENELSFQDIKEKIHKLATEWNERPHSPHVTVRQVSNLLRFLNVLVDYDFYDGKRWVFFGRDGTFRIDRYESANMNRTEDQSLTENPENDASMFEEVINPQPVNMNPTRRKRLLPGNPGATPDDTVDSNPPVQALLRELQRFI